MKYFATALIVCFGWVAASATGPDVIWHKFEELTPSAPEKNKLRMDALSEYMRADDGAIAYLVSYAGRSSCSREALDRARRVRTYLVSKGRINRSRIRIIDAGYHDDWVVELWLAPKLAPPLTKEFISKVDAHLDRAQVTVYRKCGAAVREF